jgi:carbon monoxide dehydrogenase subunit G
MSKIKWLSTNQDLIKHQALCRVSQRRFYTVKMHGTYTLNASRDKVWAFLMDPESITKVIPGCEQLEEMAPDTYQATMKLGIAAVKGVYTGSVKLLDKTSPSHYRMTIDGSGTPGFVKGEASIDLQEQDDKTVLTYDADTQVGGLIANVGQRMISGVAKLLVNQSLKKLDEELTQS